MNGPRDPEPRLDPPAEREGCEDCMCPDPDRQLEACEEDGCDCHKTHDDWEADEADSRNDRERDER